MGSYRCSRCGYKAKKEVKPSTCPYCSATGVMIEIESAEKLIQEL